MRDIRWYLVWEERTDRNKFEREFTDRESLNDFLMALDSSNVKWYKMISGITIDTKEL